MEVKAENPVEWVDCFGYLLKAVDPATGIHVSILALLLCGQA
jgi:hypothetical protein